MCAADRACLFIDGAVIGVLAREILRTCAERRFAVLAYVFMPDHAHLLIQGQDEESAFRPLMKLIRQRTGIAYRRLQKRALWQEGYFERVIRRNEQLADVCAYIAANPVRAGLAGQVEDYPFTFIACL
jgi:putative transposase